MIFDESFFPYKKNQSCITASSTSHVMSIFNSWLSPTNSNSIASIQPTTPPPPCLSSLSAIPTFDFDSHDGASSVIVNTPSTTAS